MCELFWETWYGLTHSYDEIDLDELNAYVKRKCNK